MNIPKYSASQRIQWPEDPSRIALLMPSWVGDVVMATPFISSIRERFPAADISLYFKPYLQPLLAENPWTPDLRPIPSQRRGKAYRSWLTQQRRESFDLAIMLPNSFSAAWLAWRIGARARVGFARDGRSFLLTHRIDPPNKHGKTFTPLPLVEYYAVLAQVLGAQHSGDRLQLFTTPSENTAVAERLESFRKDHRGPLVVLVPGAKFGASKCWDPIRFAAVADELASTRKAAIVISPGPGEESLAEAISGNMKQPGLLLSDPCLNLGELKSLIASADLLLGNDTGPRHFGRAFDIPRVTVFGPTEQRWTDTSHARESIVKVSVPCGPCHLKTCPLEEQVCMTGVSVEMVTAACERQLTGMENQTL